MARIPKYESNVSSQLGSSGRLEGNAPAGAFGAYTAKAQEVRAKTIGDIGDIVTERAIKLKELQDYNDAMAEYTKANGTVREYLNNSILSRKGKDAQGAVADIGDFMDKVYRESGDKILQPRTKEFFNKQWGQYREENLNTVSKHQASQFRVYLEENAGATLKNFIEDTAVDPYNEEKRQRSLNSGLSIIQSNFGGYGDEVVASKFLDYSDELYANNVQKMMLGNPVQAMQFYTANAEKMKASTKNVLSKQLQDAVIKYTSQGIADGVFAGGGSYGDMVNKTKDIKDPYLREAVTERLNTLYNQKERADKELQDNMVKGFFQEIEYKNAPTMNDIPANLPDYYKNVARSYINKVNSGSLSTDYQTYYWLRDNMDKTTDLYLYRDKLDNTRFRELLALQKGLPEGAKAGKVNKIGEPALSDVKEVFELLKGEKYDSDIGGFNDFYQFIIRNTPKDKPLTEKDIYEVGGRYFRKGKVGTNWFGSIKGEIAYNESGLFKPKLTEREEEITSSKPFINIASKHQIDIKDTSASISYLQGYYIPAEAYLTEKGIPLTEKNLSIAIAKAMTGQLDLSKYRTTK